MKQKEFKYRYEVADSESADFPKVDMAHSLHDLRAGHVYRVLFNSNPRYPQIESVIEEIKPGETVDDGLKGTE